MTWRRSSGSRLADSAEVAIFEQIAYQTTGARGDDDGIRLGQGLQAGGEVWSFADDRLLLRRAFTDQIADHHEPCSDADPRLELDGFDIEATDRSDHIQPGSDRPLGIVLMRPRVAEIKEYTVAHVFGDKPVEAADDIGDGAMIRGDDLAQIFRVESRRERCRANEIAVHHRQLPAFGVDWRR